ncbi:MAG TPA: FAD-dependent oxidoreductase [Vicinamibacterales bacterium]|jgi:2-polyprenyl-6-methoxyphenol hydroxylase-like FAD-dependent oxidoreductase
MATVLIVGGGICGLGTALLLARDGHEVTLLERDEAGIPQSGEQAWMSWERAGVAQFRQPHNFMPGLRRLLEAELPDVQERLRGSGAVRFDLVHPLPAFFTDRQARPIDDLLWTWTARRPVGEWVFAQAAQEERRVSVRRGVRVAALRSADDVKSGVPHVAGVRTTDGEELRADLVVDATGRQSCSPAWLAAIGAGPVYEEQADSGFTYYTRYFRGALPERAGPILTPFESMTLLTLPGDNDTWSITIFTSTGDQPLKHLRHEPIWTKAVASCPLHAHWLRGEAITPVLAMSGVVDRYRRFVVDGSPVATGFAAVADAAACTNPSAGRGLTVGLLHARCLRDALRTCGDDPRALVEEFDRRTEKEIAPWYHAQVAVDRARFAQLEAARSGAALPPPGELAQKIGVLMMATAVDVDLFRAALEYIGTVTPIQTILERPEVQERIRAAREAIKQSPPPRMPGPDRQQLLAIVDEAAPAV